MNAWLEPELVIEGGEPIPRQLEDQLRRQIVDRILRAGEELPTVRAVAVGLTINPLAVEEAYRRLEGAGFLIRGEGCGPRVAQLAGEPDNSLERSCREFLRRTAAQGYALTEVMQTLHLCSERG